MSNFNIEIKSLEEKMAADAPTLERYNIVNGFEAEETTCLIHETVDIGTILFFASKIPVDVCSYFRLTAKEFHLLMAAFWDAQTKWGQAKSNIIVPIFKLNTNQDCQHKLLDAGFTLFRFDLNRLEVKYCSSPGAWKLHSKGYATKAELERARKELMKDPKALEG